jgi:hypothetical protein
MLIQLILLILRLTLPRLVVAGIRLDLLLIARLGIVVLKLRITLLLLVILSRILQSLLLRKITIIRIRNLLLLTALLLRLLIALLRGSAKTVVAVAVVVIPSSSSSSSSSSAIRVASLHDEASDAFQSHLPNRLRHEPRHSRHAAHFHCKHVGVHNEILAVNIENNNNK